MLIVAVLRWSGDRTGGTGAADRTALEHALRMAKTFGGRCLAAAVGPPAADELLREALAVGADGVVRIAGHDPAADDDGAPRIATAGARTARTADRAATAGDDAGTARVTDPAVTADGDGGGTARVTDPAATADGDGGGTARVTDPAATADGDGGGTARVTDPAVIAAENADRSARTPSPAASGDGDRIARLLLDGLPDRPDVIVCGDHPADDTPAFLAQRLGVLRVLGLIELSASPEKSLHALRRLENGQEEHVTFGPPAVVSVEPSDVVPRRAPLPGKHVADAAEIPVARAGSLRYLRVDGQRPFRPRLRGIPALTAAPPDQVPAHPNGEPAHEPLNSLRRLGYRP